MSSLKQYIDLYLANRDTLDKGSAPLINRMRPAALKALEEARRLPDLADERSQHTSVEQMFAPDYGVNLGRVNIPVDIASTFACNLPNLSTLMGIVVNDAFAPTSTLVNRLPEGVIFDSLRTVASTRPDIIGKYLNTIAPQTDAGVALNTLLMQDGVVIYVPSQVKLAKPLQLVNIFSSPTPLMAMRRLLVILDDGAKADVVICDHTQDETQSYLNSQVAEVSVGKDASLGLYVLEEASLRTSRYAQTFVRQHEGSHLNMHYAALSTGTSRNEFVVDLTGEHAECLLTGMAIGMESEHVDCNTSINHRVARCRSNQIFRYVMGGVSHGVFDGGITVTPQAPYTVAYQSNRNVLATAEARMHTKPRLEIYNDEVKCSHGATIGQLNEEALFYMRSRGIPAAEARVMLMQAFMADVIDTVGLESLRDRLRHLVEMRFNGQGATCRRCSEPV